MLDSKDQKIGVCMVVGGYYPEGFGGAHQCRTLVQSLGNRYAFFILSTSFQPQRLRAYRFVDGVPVYRIRVWKHPVVNWILSAPQFIMVFLKIVSKIKIVHCHGISSKTYLATLLAKSFGKKVIHKFTSMGFDDIGSLAARWSQQGQYGGFQRKMMMQSDCFVTMTPAFLSGLRERKLEGAKIAQIPNGVNLERFYPCSNALQKEELRRQLQIPSSGKTILFVGFFSYEKGIEDLIAVWKKMTKEMGLAAHLVLVGAQRSDYYEISRELVATLRRESEQSGPVSRLFLREEVDNIEEYYRACDLFVLPSYREGLPNVLLEAMACGLPVVASRLAGITEFVVEEGKTGFLFHPGDRAELARKILKLLNHPETAEAFAMAAREKTTQDFDIKKITERYSQLYQELTQCAA
ncbi:MAG: glycosyltransferase family 4 protein [Candidatus Omnitrophica bacterium]|nr:glycosyltransferase family 4 protein [Candidatus Omnitrophota bacterium]